MKDNLHITIGFTSYSLRSKKVKYCFIAFNDCVTGVRVILVQRGDGFILQPVKDWKRKHCIIKQFGCSIDLSDSLKVLNDIINQGFEYKRVVVYMLQNVNLASHLDSENPNIEDLYEYLDVSDLFKESNPEDILSYE